ncbi:hypothetical protein FQZ97_585000 [compost metagenome]
MRTVLPWLSKRSRISGCSSTVFTAALSLSTMCASVPLGAKMPNQMALSKPLVPGRPLEAMVGTSFTAGTAVAVVTPSRRTLPAL